MAAIDDFRAGVSVWFFIFMIADVLTGNVAAPWLPLAVVSTACSVVLMLVSIKETDSEKIDKLKSLKAGLESKCPMLVSKAAKGAIVILLMLVSWLSVLGSFRGSFWFGVIVAFVAGEVTNVVSRIFRCCCGNARKETSGKKEE
mmetsp:Transcript_118312/g.368458  ORF Transcript_118312/g.368458 Transcript_118312/m.368458 type:complete len:144 (+) Transcript_118312:87-518(+)